MTLRLCLLTIFLFPLCSISQLCKADETPNGWSGEGSLNANINTGSSNTTNVGLGLKLNREIDEWTVKLEADADYGDTKQGKNKNQNDFLARLDYDIGEKWIGFVQGDYRFNEISNYDYRSTIGAGFGYRIYDKEQIEWTVRASLGVRIEEFKVPKTIGEMGTIITGNSSESPDKKDSNLDIESDFAYQFNDDVAFGYQLDVAMSEDKTETKIDTHLSAAISGALSARFEYQLIHDDSPATGGVATETVTRFSLVYKFGD